MGLESQNCGGEKSHNLGYTARRKVDFPRQGLSTVLLEEAWVGAPTMGSRAGTSPGIGGLAGPPLTKKGCRMQTRRGTRGTGGR